MPSERKQRMREIGDALPQWKASVEHGEVQFEAANGPAKTEAEEANYPWGVPLVPLSHLEAAESRAIEAEGDWHYGAIRMGRRWYAKRFHPSTGDNDGDLPDVGDTEFWDGEWKPYSIAAFQERERAAGFLGVPSEQRCTCGLPTERIEEDA